ncbi:sugar transferase [Paraburkholderia sp. J76]|uniref:sugar transferase n=1 Tax=Paraburkholderia sp. J76 TaxID=2805439 RepID=UPI0039F54803
MLRLSAKPGITGLWLIAGPSSFERMIAIDLDYVHRQSFGLDLMIMWQTVIRAFTHDRAY